MNTAGKLESGDKLYVYNEQYNGDKTTDYASNLVEVNLPTSGSHDWAEADCTTPKTCNICGNTEGEALGHDYQDVDGTAANATCTEAGKEADQECSRCGDMIYGNEIPAAGHDWIVDESTDQDGWRTSTTGSDMHKERTCKNCDLTEEMTIVADHEHSYSSMGYCEEKPATCTENGVRAHYECSCGYWFEEGSDGTPVVEDPTGEGLTSDAFVIESQGGHEWNDATCVIPRTCVRCGATKGSPLAHIRVFDGWVWTGDETNGYTNVVANYVCTRDNCGDVKAAPTDLTSTVTPSTCTAGGKTVYRAVVTQLDALDNTYRSEKREGKFTDPLGHDNQEVEDSAVEPTCTETGKEADQKCSRCDAVTVGPEIEALGHDYQEVADSAVEPTCTEAGKEADQKCSRCGDENGRAS